MTPVLMCAHNSINQWSQIPSLDPCALGKWELIHKIMLLRVDKMKFFFLLSFPSMFLSFTYHSSAQQSISDHLWDSNPAAMAEGDNNKETFWTQWVVYRTIPLCVTKQLFLAQSQHYNNHCVTIRNSSDSRHVVKICIFSMRPTKFAVS